MMVGIGRPVAGSDLCLAPSRSAGLGAGYGRMFPDLDPLTVRFTDLHRYVTELEGFADDPTKSNEPRLEAIQMAWHEEFEDAKD